MLTVTKYVIYIVTVTAEMRQNYLHFSLLVKLLHKCPARMIRFKLYSQGGKTLGFPILLMYVNVTLGSSHTSHQRVVPDPSV